jgi:dGTPase
MRSPFQRDRDRILHSTAFRRLTHKTQVFVYHEGDHYRSRLTHSLEVAQIARSMARMLKLDEDLAEALALAHDLGHPPFGHAGERALDDVMRNWGGFDHNAQSLRVVTLLERKYAAYDGLNLAWETLEGLVKHNGPISGPHAGGGDPTGAIASYSSRHDLELGAFPSAEAQVAALADDIAYNNHDLDDGLRAGLLSIADLREVPIVRRYLDLVERAHQATDEPRKIYEINRRMITAMVTDVVAEARRRLTRLSPRSVDDIRGAGIPVVGFSEEMGEEVSALRKFLFASVYRHPKVMGVVRQAESVVRDLSLRYLADRDALPAPWQRAGRELPEPEAAGLVRDFVGGMTDRYAIDEHRRLFDATPELR